MMLRKASLDLGRKYTQRIMVYCSVFMFFYLSLFAIIVLSLLQLLRYDFSVGFYIAGTFDVTVVLGIMLQILRIGAKVNNYFDEHKASLLKLKQNIWRAKNNYTLVMSQKHHGYRSQKRFAELVSAMNIKKEKRDDHFQKLLDQIDFIIEDLEF